MSVITDLFGNQSFINFLSTFGLAVVLVIYFVFFRDRKRDEYFQSKYDLLEKDYRSLSDTYDRLENDLRPETRMCTDEQVARLAYLGLDRDLYKLHYYLSQKIDGRRQENIEYFIQDTIRATNESWFKFTTLFPKVPHITNLYPIYKLNGMTLKHELENIMQSDIPDQEKKDEIYNILAAHCVRQKQEMDENLNKHKQGSEVNECIE
ncbi:MAG: hypothetical protein KZQ95_10255 [Candidatus Thiodiazotropha sp. (ex Epidulcina cf. delphinae)]|nr:hypothetical protein [Candidatus Thiodiazotropha sp. (ex Epidulcina cf. delphinae)]